MYIKNIIIILWLGVMSSSQVLFAECIKTEKLKNESMLEIPYIAEEFSIQEDSLRIVSPVEEKPVNIPYGQSTTRNYPGNITIINSEELLKYDNVATISEIISGRVPGAYGAINFRGIGNAEVIVDGFPRDISNVNISEVEQITILKDANSAMLYGVNANRGVILITTKRGSEDERKINTIVETGLHTPISYPEFLGAARYMELYNEALRNDGLEHIYSQREIEGTRDGTNIYRYPDFEYYSSEFLNNYKLSSRVETEFRGGDQRAYYFANIGWQQSGGLLKMTEDPLNEHRLNLRSNLDFKITDFITSHVDVATIFNIENVLPRDFYGNAATLKPNEYSPLIDTTIVGNKEIIETATLVQGGNLLGGTSLYRTNVYGDLLLGGYTKQYNTYGMFNLGLDFDLNSILEGLIFKTRGRFDFYTQFSETQENTYAIYESSWTEGYAGQDSLVLQRLGEDKFTGTQGIADTDMARNSTYFGMLDYSRVFDGNHALSASIMGYYNQDEATYMYQDEKKMHLGSRIYYVYNDKYMINFSSALVSSPKLSPENRVAFSPSVALGWIISEEEFLNNSSIIDLLKLKISGGIIHSDLNLNRYYTYENIFSGSANYIYGPTGNMSFSSTVITNRANPNLFYEKRKEFTAGAEMLLFDRSLWIEANYFRETQSDKYRMSGLINTYPSITGRIYPVENFGEDRYTGMELGVSWRKTMGDFSFNIGPSLLFLNSEVIKLDEMYSEDYLYREGKSTGAIFGLEALGLFQTQEEIDAHPTQMFGTVQPGDIKYKDQNGNGIIDENDVIKIGNSLANFVGGLTINIHFKNFTLFALGTIRDGSQRFFNNQYYWIHGSRKYSEVVENRWTPETSATATYPRLSTRTSPNNFRSSTYWLEENRLISLSRLQLSYDLPQSLASRLFTSNFSLYARGSNILNIAENKDKMELNIASEPQYRYYSFGLKANF